MTKNRPSLSRIKDCIEYCPSSGILKWKVNIGSRAKIGNIVGTTTRQGHLSFVLDGSPINNHSAAWEIHYGHLPSGVIRHKNGIRSDNRIENLYQSTKKEIGEEHSSEELSPKTVQDIFIYKDGDLFWKTSLTGKYRVAGRKAGYVNGGYVKIQVGRKTFSAHRIIWMMFNGNWPLGEIDHINGQRIDNRIENLRDVNHNVNTENRRTANSGSATGYLGVSFHEGSGKYRARIRSNGALISLGLFQNPEEAHKSYLIAKRNLHDGCTI